jgi:hypothetical protein
MANPTEDNKTVGIDRLSRTRPEVLRPAPVA